MIFQLALGSLIISLTLAVQALFIGAAIKALSRVGERLVGHHELRNTVAILICVTLWLMAAHSIGVWIWAATFVLIGAFESMEPAVYFSVVSFTTLGFGDVLLPERWRLLSGLSAANGLLVFGFSTAFLVEVMIRVRKAQDANPE